MTISIAPVETRSDRRQFVGLESLDGRLLPVGGHVLKPGEAAPARSQGWVTSSVRSPTLGRPHALAMIEAAERAGHYMPARVLNIMAALTRSAETSALSKRAL